MSGPESQAGRCIAHVDLDGKALIIISPANCMALWYTILSDELSPPCSVLRSGRGQTLSPHKGAAFSSDTGDNLHFSYGSH